MGRRPNSHRLVVIEWRDAEEDAPDWKQVSELEPSKTNLVRSVGWVVKDLKKTIILAADTGKHDEDTSRRIEIPKGTILNITRLP